MFACFKHWWQRWFGTTTVITRLRGDRVIYSINDKVTYAGPIDDAPAHVVKQVNIMRKRLKDLESPINDTIWDQDNY